MIDFTRSCERRETIFIIAAGGDEADSETHLEFESQFGRSGSQEVLFFFFGK